jgi:TFIIF-interacting CTD phosphatase-like protein
MKDVSRLGRELNSVVLIDHLPSVYKGYSLNGIGISSWYGDKSDK